MQSYQNIQPYCCLHGYDHHHHKLTITNSILVVLGIWQIIIKETLVDEKKIVKVLPQELPIDIISIRISVRRTEKTSLNLIARKDVLMMNVSQESPIFDGQENLNSCIWMEPDT